MRQRFLLMLGISTGMFAFGYSHYANAHVAAMKSEGRAHKKINTVPGHTHFTIDNVNTLRKAMTASMQGERARTLISENGREVVLTSTDTYRPLKSITQIWDNTSWFNKEQVLFTYTAQGLSDVELRQSWSGTAWSDERRILFVYDANSCKVEEVHQYWGGSAWFDDEKFVFSYDANDNLTEWIWRFWEGTKWSEVQRKTITYDFSGYQDIVITQNWNGINWANLVRSDYAYDTLGNLIEEIGETWVGSWMKVYKDKYTYDGNNNLTEKLTQIWFGSWGDYLRTRTAYDFGGKRSEELTQSWSGTEWLNDSKIIYLYTIYGDEQERQYLQYANGVWEKIDRFTFAYDASGNVIESIEQWWSGSAWSNVERTAHEYEKITWVFSDTRGGGSDPDDFSLTNYPNPFNAQTMISFALQKDAEVSLVIYDITGKMVTSLLVDQHYAAGPHKVIWDGTDQQNHPLASGVYLYRIYAGSFNHAERCVLIR